MRSIAVCLLAVALVGMTASAQQCATVASNVFMTASAGCPAAARCHDARTACLATASCTTAGACFATELRCLLGLTAVRSNTSDPCSTLGNNLYIAQLAAAAASSLNGTQLDQSCRERVCVGLNASATLRLCAAEAVGPVCTAGTLLNSTAVSSAPVGSAGATSAAPVQRFAIRGSFRFSGADWAAIVNNPTRAAAARIAIARDIAALLGIAASFVQVVSLTLGSLVVEYSVLEGSGRSAAQLSTSVAGAQGSSAWLTSTQSEYAQVSNGTISALSATVTETGAPETLAAGETTAASGRTPSSAFGVAGVWAVAAAAAVAALLA